MATTRTATLRAIDAFVAAAQEKIDVKKVVLFGSHANGHVKRWSDIDIAVVSDSFEGMTTKERTMLLSKIAWKQQVTEIDALGYTEAEFAVESPLDLVTEIKAHGIVVYSKE